MPLVRLEASRLCNPGSRVAADAVGEGDGPAAARWRGLDPARRQLVEALRGPTARAPPRRRSTKITKVQSYPQLRTLTPLAIFVARLRARLWSTPVLPQPFLNFTSTRWPISSGA